MVLAPKRRLAIGMSVLAVTLVGAGTASACDGGGTQTTGVKAAQFTAWHLGHHLGWWRAGLLQTTASYLGLTPPQLVADLRAGKSLSQVAPSGASAAGLANAWLAAAKSRLDAAVAAGRLTSSQEDAMLAALTPKLTAWASVVWTKTWAGDRDGH